MAINPDQRLVGDARADARPTNNPAPPARLRSVAGADSTVDRVATEVRRAVLDGSLAPGSSFSISELAEQLGVSHIPVREALTRLDAQGLIILRRGRSAVVAPLDREELCGIYRLRRRIEPDLAARSAELLTSRDVAELRRLFDAIGDPDVDVDGLWHTHHEFHLVLLRPVASAWDLRILEQLWRAADRYTRIVFDSSPQRRVERHAAHQALVTAAASGSPADLARAVDDHLTANEQACLARLPLATGS